MKRHVLVLGAGFGGLELATQLSEAIPDEVRVTLLDRSDSFFFGFSKLDVMLGRHRPEDVRLSYGLLDKPSVEFRQETVVQIDPAARRATTAKGTYEADFLVVALGADYDIAATPGLAEGGHEFYTLEGAARLRDALDTFEGGKVLVSVLGQPFKCPPAPFEGAFLLHQELVKRGVRDSSQIAAAFPMARPVPVTGEVSGLFRQALAERGIQELAEHLVTAIDPEQRTAQLADGTSLSYDLFVGIPIHRAPEPLAASGMLENGWLPVDQASLRTRFPGVYAIGDVCTGPRMVPKAGIFAEAAARVVAQDIAAQVTGGARPGPFAGSGTCYAEFGDGLVGKVEVNFLEGPQPSAVAHAPSRETAAEKASFGALRRARWFGLTDQPA